MLYRENGKNCVFKYGVILEGKDCIRHTIRSIASGKASGSEGVVLDTAAHGKSPKSAVQQVLVYISRCL